MDNDVKEARELFDLAAQAEEENRDAALDDIRFARLGEQWPDDVKSNREVKGRPCLVINKLPSYIRQVVNDSRQNKPSIRARPVDNNADPETAEIITGLMRNIEYTSNADVAYDTAIESAVTGGFGYWRVNIDYAHDDTFDLDIRIDRIANPFSVYGDPFSTAADSSDWNCSFIVNKIKKDEFKRKYKKAYQANWQEYDNIDSTWLEEESVMLAEYWRREETERTILLLSDGSIIGKDEFDKNSDYLLSMGYQVVGDRNTKSWKVTQKIMSGVEILEENDWPGIYIPIVPVYGEEVNVDGKRYFKSMIRDAKDPQRMLNYWRSASTELVALAPKAPYVGRKGSFDTDAHKWATANTENHAYIEYDGAEPPQRQPFSGVPAGSLQEAMNASDDIKSILGMFEPSMGAQGNETSGRAIIARQRESDTGQFHFVDNLARSIRHTGRIIIDLIPHVYTGDRVVRVIGEDGSTAENATLGRAGEVENENGEISKIYDLSAGKYDIVVDTGANYATKRQEAAEQMTGLMDVYPQSAPLIADLLAKNLDWPGADEIAKRFKAMLPPQVLKEEEHGAESMIMQQANEQMQQMQMQMQQMQDQATQAVQQAQQEAMQAQQEAIQLKMQVEAAKQDAEINMVRAQLDAAKIETDRFKAETDRMKALQDMETQQFNERMIAQSNEFKPRVKRSRAIRDQDGSWHIETIEQSMENNTEEDVNNG